MNKLFLLSIVLPEPALLTHISALPSIPCFDFCAVVLPPRMNFLFVPIRESFCESSLSVCLPAFLPISRVDIAQHTSVCTHNCISYSNTPNTGCPVLGVHITESICHTVSPSTAHGLPALSQVRLSGFVISGKRRIVFYCFSVSES